MLGPNLASQKIVRFVSLLYLPTFQPASFIARKPASKLSEKKLAARNGLSLARNGHTLSGTPTAGSTIPAYSFAATLRICLAR